MTEPRRPSRRRTSAVADQPSTEGADLNPYREDDAAAVATTTAPSEPRGETPAPAPADAPVEASTADGAGERPARRTRAARPARRPRAADVDGAAPAAEAGAEMAAVVAAAAAGTEPTPAAQAHAAPAPDAFVQPEAPQAPPASTTDAAPPAQVSGAGDSAPPPRAPDGRAPQDTRPQDGQGRPHGRHARNEGRRDNRHDGRPPRHERFDRQQHGQPQGQGAAPNGGAPANGAYAAQGGPDSPGGQNPGQPQGQQQRREFFEGGRRQRHRQRGRFRDGNGQNGQGGEFRDAPHPAQQHPRDHQRDQRQPVPALVADTEVTGWLELARDGSAFVRQAANSYLVGPNDPFVPVGMVRQNNLRAGDGVVVGAGRDFRQRPVAVEVRSVNGAPPQPGVKRPDFQSLLATYPDRKLTLETGKPAGRGGPELTRRIIDLIAPLGFGQRALIVAPARSGKTILLQTIVEGVALNHPDAELILLLVDERPEEVSEMVACGYGEVVASSFDMPADRHRDVVTMVMHRAQRLVEAGKDVVIVLDSITRMARAFNATKGVGRTLSGGLDAQAMATPKAFFGSARSVAASHGGGSITIIGTALVETGSRMDDVIFEEFKGTGNCEIKLDRNLAEQRIFPAIDVPASGTRREDKLFRPDQLDAVYLLRRGLQSMPPSAAMNWLTKRIASTPNNDVLLATLKDT